MLQYTKNTVIIMDGSSEAQDAECAILSNESNQGIVLHQVSTLDKLRFVWSTFVNIESDLAVRV
jgi:hypothetical protein